MKPYPFAASGLPRGEPDGGEQVGDRQDVQRDHADGGRATPRPWRSGWLNSLAEYAGYFDSGASTGRPARLHGSIDSGIDVRRELWNRRARV